MRNKFSAVKKYKALGGYGKANIFACYVLKGAKAASGLHKIQVTYAPKIHEIVRPKNFEDVVFLGYEVSEVE